MTLDKWLPSYTWVDFLGKYTNSRQIEKCPSMVRTQRLLGYGYNYLTLGYQVDLTNYAGYMAYSGVATMSDIAQPTRTVAICDSSNAASQDWVWIEIPNSSANTPDKLRNGSYIDCRHFEGAHMLFVDQHVKWMSASDIAKHASPVASNGNKGFVKGGLNNWFDRQ